MEALVNNLIKATGWSIFHSLWQGAIIYGILFLIVMAMPKLKARLKHNFAYGALCLIFICFCITFFSVFKLPAESGNANGTMLTMNAVYHDYLSTIPQDFSSRTEQMFPYIVSVYGIGILCQLLIIFVGYKRMSELKNADRSAVPAEWALAFESLISKLNLKQHIGFSLSGQVNVPLVIGYFKPVVLFPIALATQLDIKQVEAILIHELSHIRRNDYLLNLIKTGIETILFFNPFVWLSGRFINIEREHACDDLVVQLTGTPVTYAHALLKLEILKDKSAPALSMAATGKNQHLYQRIKRITDMKTNYMNAKQQIFAITLTLATVISLAWVKPSKAENTTIANTPQTKDIEIAGVGLKFKLQNLPNIKKINKVASAYADTTKKKTRFKLVRVDDNGVRHEYNSINEVPDSLKNCVIGSSFISFPNTPTATPLPPMPPMPMSVNAPQPPSFPVNVQIDTMINASVAFMKSPEWKKNIAAIQKSGTAMTEYFNSKEWKRQKTNIQRGVNEVRQQLNTPEFRKQQAEIVRQQVQIALTMAKISKQEAEINKRGAEMNKYGAETGKYFESPEWKKHVAELEKSGTEMDAYFNSPEWKKQQEVIERNAEKLQFEADEQPERRERQEWSAQPERRERKEVAEARELKNTAAYKELQKNFTRSLQNSSEYKEMKKKFDKDVEALKKKKNTNTETKVDN